MTTAIKWSMRYGALYVTIHDSLEDAASAAFWASEWGEEAVLNEWSLTDDLVVTATVYGSGGTHSSAAVWS